MIDMRIEKVITQSEYNDIADKYISLWLVENLANDFDYPSRFTMNQQKTIGKKMVEVICHRDNTIEKPTTDKEFYKFLDNWLNNEFWTKESKASRLQMFSRILDKY